MTLSRDVGTDLIHFAHDYDSLSTQAEKVQYESELRLRNYSREELVQACLNSTAGHLVPSQFCGTVVVPDLEGRLFLISPNNYGIIL